MSLENRAVNGERKIVQAMLYRLGYYDGSLDGKHSQMFYESLVTIRSVVGSRIRKVNETIMVTPNGLIMQELTKTAPKVDPKMGDMKLVGLMGEVIHCTDANWKLNIISAGSMPLPKVGRKVSEKAKALHKVITDIWKETKLPFTLSKEDFTKQENGKWQFILRLPHIEWLQNDCSFTAPIPTAISEYIVKQLASIGFIAQEKVSGFDVTWDGAASDSSQKLTKAEMQKIALIIKNIPAYLHPKHGKMLGLASAPKNTSLQQLCAAVAQ